MLLLTPDVSMMGYVFVNNAGAVAYNIFHHKAVALAIYGLGAYQQNENTETRGNYFIRSLVNGQDIWIWVENIQRV